MLADTLARYIRQDYPLAARLAAGASASGFAPEKWQEMVDLGVLGALFDEVSGGFGGAGFDLMVVFQAFGDGLIVEPFLQSAILAGGVLARAADDGQKQVLQALVAGEKRGALAHFEAGDGWEAAHIGTRAEQTGGGWRLNGQKSVVRAAGSADFLIVSARSSGEAGDAAGLSLFLLPADTAGVQVQDYQTIDGGRAADVMLKDVDLPPSALVGVAGQGSALLTEVLGRGVLCLSAEAIGLMDRIRDMTLDYLRNRKQFGLPIGKFQALQHRMATLVLEIEQARAAVINAAAHMDTPGVARERALSAAKFTVAEVGTLVLEEAIQMHGGMGMTWEYPLGHYAKRLSMIGHEMGDADFHLQRYISLGRAAA